MLLGGTNFKFEFFCQHFITMLKFGTVAGYIRYRRDVVHCGCAIFMVLLSTNSTTNPVYHQHALSTILYYTSPLDRPTILLYQLYQPTIPVHYISPSSAATRSGLVQISSSSFAARKTMNKSSWSIQLHGRPLHLIS